MRSTDRARGELAMLVLLGGVSRGGRRFPKIRARQPFRNSAICRTFQLDSGLRRNGYAVLPFRDKRLLNAHLLPKLLLGQTNRFSVLANEVHDGSIRRRYETVKPVSEVPATIFRSAILTLLYVNQNKFLKTIPGLLTYLFP